MGARFTNPWAKKTMFGWICFTCFLGSMIHGDPTYKNGERINERKVKHAFGLSIGCIKFLLPKEFGIRVKLGSKNRCCEPTLRSKDSKKVKLDLGSIPK